MNCFILQYFIELRHLLRGIFSTLYKYWNIGGDFIFSIFMAIKTVVHFHGDVFLLIFSIGNMFPASLLTKNIIKYFISYFCLHSIWITLRCSNWDFSIYCLLRPIDISKHLSATSIFRNICLYLYESRKLAFPWKIIYTCRKMH